jgi:hypothetical protein
MAPVKKSEINSRGDQPRCPRDTQLSAKVGIEGRRPAATIGRYISLVY